MEYVVRIEETLVKLVKVEADTENEARGKVREAYSDRKIVLNGDDDYVCHEIEVMPEGCGEHDPGSDSWEKIE